MEFSVVVHDHGILCTRAKDKFQSPIPTLRHTQRRIEMHRREIALGLQELRGTVSRGIIDHQDTDTAINILGLEGFNCLASQVQIVAYWSQYWIEHHCSMRMAE